MVQEEMFVDAVSDSDSGADNPEFSPCRILSFDETEPCSCINERLSHYIYLLDK